jgi:glycerophosphoryl diester phosphodiesterase
VRRNYLRHPATRPLALAAAVYGRRVLPTRLVRALRAGEVDAVMAHWVLVTPAFWRAIREAGGELYVWTVDDPREIARLEALEVTGIITNDPRLFG